MRIISVLEAILLGIFSALVPGFHPILLRLTSDVAAALVFGVYTSLSIVPSVYLGAFSAATAYTYIVAHRLVSGGKGLYAVYLYVLGTVLGIILAFLYYPLSVLLSVRLPRAVLFFILVYVAVLSVLRSARPIPAAILAVFYSMYGYLVLNYYPLDNALPAAISGLFGGSTIFLALLSKEVYPLGDVCSVDIVSLLRGAVFGLLIAFAVSYFPAVSLSLAAFLVQPILSVRDEEMMVAAGSSASASLILTGTGRSYGLVRSSFAAALSSSPSFSTLLVASAAVLIGAALAILLTPFLYRIYSNRFVKAAAFIAIVAGAGVFLGVPSVPLVLASTFAGTLTHIFGVEKRVAMFFLLFPTLLYYAPM